MFHSTQKNRNSWRRLLAGLFLILLLPVLLINLSLIVQSALWPDRLPTVFQYKALILLPEDASGSRSVGLIRSVEPTQLRLKDTITYRQGQTFFIETVSQISNEQGRPALVTVAGPEVDAPRTQVPPSQVEGILVWRIPRLGDVALFMQTPAGLLLFLVLPILLNFLTDTWTGRRRSEQQPALDAA